MAYRKQIFACACMHLLNFGKRIDEAYVMNFVTGKVFFMDLSHLTFEIACTHVRNLGAGVCPEHAQLFSGLPCIPEDLIRIFTFDENPVNLQSAKPVLLQQRERILERSVSMARARSRSVSVVDAAENLMRGSNINNVTSRMTWRDMGYNFVAAFVFVFVCLVIAEVRSRKQR